MRIRSARTGLRALLLAAAGGLGLLVLAPSPAHAGDEFEDGFKDELGRIAAHEAFGVGRHILADVFLGHGGHYYGSRPVHHRTYYRHSAYRGGHDHRYRRHHHRSYPKRHYRGHRGHAYGKHRGHGHGHRYGHGHRHGHGCGH